MPDAPVNALPPVEDAQARVARAKAAWRTRAANLSWEEKIAAIERMRERDAVLRREREAAQVGRGLRSVLK